MQDFRTPFCCSKIPMNTRKHFSEKWPTVWACALKAVRQPWPISISRVGSQSDPCTATIFWSIVRPHMLYSASSPVPLTKYSPDLEWGVALCSLVDTDWRFGRSYYLYHHDDRRSISARLQGASPHNTDITTLVAMWTLNTSSFPFPFVPLQRRGCLVAPWFLWIVLAPCAGD
jgi:hypothetical protein